jgi:hypothetical protein
MVDVQEHREARKERERPPIAVRESVELVLSVLGADPCADALVRERLRGWGKRVMLVYGTASQGTSYRMAWEVTIDNVLVWAYGAHEGFYKRLACRARK